MDARLPPTLRVNRGDIKELNERANLLKIINDRKNALKKRKELQKEYDDIMKRLFKSQQKKKKRIAKGRGGIRTSRSWEKRQQERHKRGERRAEGQDEPSVIGEEVSKDSQGNMIITYRDYEKEAQARQEGDIMVEARRIEDRQERQLQMDRLDQIRREDIQLRFDERQRDRDDRLRREDEQFRIARENRTHEDLWRDLIMRRDDKILDNIGRRLDIAQEQMGQGRQFIDALRDLELRFNQRFDAAEVQWRNLLQTNPGGIDIQDLQQQNPQLGQPQAESEFIELRDDVETMPTLEELLEEKVVIPTEETDEDFEGPRDTPKELLIDLQTMEYQGEGALAGEYFADEGPAPAPEQPYKPPQARMYTEDLKPQGEDYGVKVGGEKELRQPRKKGRSLKEDIEIIDRIGGITAPPEGTPERIEWDNQLFAGKLDVSKNLALQEIAEENRVANLMREANNERLQIQELKDREQELQERIVKEGQARDLTLSAEKIRKQIIDEEPGDLFFMKNPLNFTEDKVSFSNPMNKLLEQNKQELIDNLPDGAVVSEDLKKIGFTNPVLPLEQQEEVAEESGLVRVGSQGAKDIGIVKTPREVIQVNPLLEDERFIGFLQDVYNGAISENPKQINLKNKNRQFFINKGYANQDEALRDALDVFGIRYRKKDNKTTLMRKLQAEIDDGDYKERLNTRYGGSVQGTAVYRKLGRALGGFSGSSEEGGSTQGASGPQGEDVADLPLPYESPPVSQTWSQSGTSSDDDPNVYTHIPITNNSSDEELFYLGTASSSEGESSTSQPQGEDTAELPRMTTLQAIQELPIDDKGQALGGRIEGLQKKLPHEHTLKDLIDNTPLLDSEDYQNAEEIHRDNVLEGYNFSWFLKHHGKGDGDGYDSDELEDLGIDDDDLHWGNDLLLEKIPDHETHVHDAIHNEAIDDVEIYQKEYLAQLMNKENRIKKYGKYEPITARQAAREFIRDYGDHEEDYKIDKFETEVEGREDIPTPKPKELIDVSSESSESSEDIPTPKPKFNIDELQKGMRIKVKGEQEGKIENINRDEGKFKGVISFRTPDMPTARKVLYPHEHHEIEDVGGFATEQKGPGSMKKLRRLGPGALKLPMGEKFVSPLVEDLPRTATPSVAEKEGNFIPGKYEKGQSVMYFRKDKGKKGGNWETAKIGNYQDGGPDGALISVKLGKKREVETTMDKVIPTPNTGELLQQDALREGLREGILREGESRKRDKKGPYWEDRDKYLIHNNTSTTFRDILPYGKAVLHHHKKDPKGGDGEFSYTFTPLNEEGGWMEQASAPRQLNHKELHRSTKYGLIKLEKLDEKVPFKKGSKKEKRPAYEGRPSGIKTGFAEAPQPEQEPSMLAGAGEVVGNIAGGVASAGAGLIGGIAGGVAAQLPTPYEAGVGVGGALAGAGVGLLQGAAGLVAGAIGGGAESDSDESI